MFDHQLEVGPFPSDFIFSSVPGPLLRADKELVSTREVLDFLIDIVEFTFVIFQVQGDGAYPLGIDDPPYSIGFCVVPFF